MAESSKYQEWLQLRQRLLERERAFARAYDAMTRGEEIDLEEVSIQQSEIRALRALSRAMILRSVSPSVQSRVDGRSEGPSSCSM